MDLILKLNVPLRVALPNHELQTNLQYVRNSCEDVKFCGRTGSENIICVNIKCCGEMRVVIMPN